VLYDGRALRFKRCVVCGATLCNLSDCELCKRERVTEWRYEDDLVWVARCKSHPDKWMIIIKRHSSEPNEDERKRISEVKDRFFPKLQFRGPQSILDHYHIHEI